MNRITTVLTRGATLAAVATAGLALTVGTALADGWPPDHNHDHINDSTHNSAKKATNTVVHSSGSGGTAVNVAGGSGKAVQNVDQHKNDKSEHTHYRNNPHIVHRKTVGSNNVNRYRDSHAGPRPY